MGSRIRLGRWQFVLSAAALVQALWAAPSLAQDQPLKGDPVHGKAISYTCLGCHGVEGYRNAYPNYSVPRLVGQHPEYIVAALQEYKAGQRSHVTMHNQASSLSDQDMADIAAYFAGKPLDPIAPTTADPPPAAATLCAACHGATGVSAVPGYPNLAGQHEDYLRREIAEYKDGGRKNPIMSSMAATIKDADVDALAAYFGRQRPGLGTVNRPTSIVTAGR